MALGIARAGFHNSRGHYAAARQRLAAHHETRFTYTFDNFFHPCVGELIKRLNQKSLTGMLDPAFHEGLSSEFFGTFYESLVSATVGLVHFPKEIDLRNGGPYANYNWELLFHFPLTIAVHLSKNQRFAEAQRWFHYIFDPTSTDPSVDPPGRYWRFLRFRQSTDVQQIGDLLALLSKPDEECSAAERDLKAGVLNGYEWIRNHPFQPHGVARTRTVAYQYAVLMKYLDNLIAWGDSLFQQDTIESVNEATQRYVLAANLLGPRPQQVPPSGTVRPRTFAELKAAALDAMGNAMVELEGQFPFNLAMSQAANDGAPDQSGPLFGVGRTLYFCVPRNENLLTYWDTVGDRLFKIRHCMNIEGAVRQLPLFDPPIDPGMLVKAAAAGIDIASIVSGLNQPIGPVRSLALIQKALELAGEVRGLGNALLSALEKRDAERLALLRQAHEIKIQAMTQDVRFLQWKSAQAATDSLLKNRESALERYRYYQRLLGITPDDAAVPESLPIDRRDLTEENFEEWYDALVGQYKQYEQAMGTEPFSALKLVGESSPATQSGESGPGNLFLSTNEDAELNHHLRNARDTRLAAMTSDSIFAALALIPNIGLDAAFWGVGGHSDIVGGSLFANEGRFIASVLNAYATNQEAHGASAAKTAGYQRRADDYLFQSNLAAHELTQIGRQVISSLIAEQIAHSEYLTTVRQVAQSREVNEFLREKFTGEELYGWLQGEMSRLYYQYYRFAFDTARKAERTMKQELMRPELDGIDYVKFNYWDAGRKGLLSGEALSLDLKRMEMAYHENNRREFELVRHVSLLQVDPRAFLQLRATGRCAMVLPEALFDMDGPGHYFRRIKSVAVSIPCVAGPYTSVNCTLTLVRSAIRKSPLLANGGYAREGAEDDRFSDNFGSLQSVVTSAGQNDSGLFETNLHDERYLPFEGSGAISQWKLELPADIRQFDYDTIADVLIHVRYTAREGGGLLRNGAVANLKELIDNAGATGSTRLFSIRHEFPMEWSRFRSIPLTTATPVAELTLNLRPEHYPIWSEGRLEALKSVDLFARTARSSVEVTDHPDGTGNTDSLVPDNALGSLRAGRLENIPLPAPTGRFTLYFNDTSMEDLWLALAWGRED